MNTFLYTICCAFSALRKLFEVLLRNRLKEETDAHRYLSDLPIGFKPSRSTFDTLRFEMDISDGKWRQII